MKRFLCLMLTLIMLVGLVPATAISVSAASHTTSEAAITVLKKMTTFKDTCYKVSDTQQYRIGYGTVCGEEHTGNKTHTVTEKQADTALRAYLKEMDKKVDAFESANKLSLKQNQHDALVVFSFNVGTAWMNGNGVIKTALVNGAGTNELLAAMTTVGGDMERRKIEVNMYVNGVYSNVIVDTYKWVMYDANGSQDEPAYMTPHDDGNKGRYTMQFDTANTVPHIPTPTRAGYTFMGWYLNNEWKPNLTADCGYRPEELNGKEPPMLLARWQKSNLDPEDAWKDATANSYFVEKSKLASNKVYTRPVASKDYLLDKATLDFDPLEVRYEYVTADGVRWVQVKYMEPVTYDKLHNATKHPMWGWVMLKATSNGGTTSGGVHAEIDVTVTVTNSYVNSRVNATVYSAKNGTYSQGAKLRIINTDSHDGFLWGQIAKSATDDTPIGWVALMYTNWNSVKDNGSSSGSANTSNAIAKATVTYNGYVNLRSAAGTDNKIVGSLYKNETVDIFEIKTVDGHQWGRTKGGWLCLTYTSLTMLGNNKNDMVSNEGALNYVFTGNAMEDMSPRVSPSDSAEYVQHYYEYEDKKDIMNPKKQMDIWPKRGEKVTIANMVVERDGSLWVKISWRVDLDRDGAKDTTKTGWVKMTVMKYVENGLDANLSLDSKPVSMDPARFTVVADEVTVRTEPDSGAAALSVKLNRGVNVKVNAIMLVGENMWGYMESERVVDANSQYTDCDGWINLASKYVQRSDKPIIEGDKETLSPIGKIATIVNTDSVNVRINGTKYDKIIGKLSRGTRANVLEISKNGDWYNLDIDVDKNPKTGSWVYKDYLEISDGTIGGSGSNGGSGSAPAPVVTGKGVVANTYAGVNIREGAGQAYRQVGKLLPGTVVDVLEIKQSGAAKWARIAQGWVCMDYITMLTEEVTYPEGSTAPDGSTTVGSYDEVDRTTTTAVYTGKVKADTKLYANTQHHGKDEVPEGSPSFVVREVKQGERLTIYELIAVTEKYMPEDEGHVDDGHGSTSETTVTSYWARVNDGYIWNPQDYIELDALDEKVHTLTGSDTLNIRKDAAGDLFDPELKLEKGDQVKVTALKIVYDKVWGRIEYEGHIGWIRLDYMSEGAYKVQEKPTQPQTPAPTDPIIGAGSSNGGVVNNSKGYRYTGKIINTNQVNVRATPATSAKITTTLKSGASLVIYETTTAESMAWGRCDAGWVYLYYVDLTPVTSNGAVDARVVANNKAGIIYSDSTGSETVGTYAGMSVIDIYEIVNGRARTELGWISTDDLL